MATKPHAILIPYPAQGHVIPMFDLAHLLARHGIKVSFVNTEFNHRRIMESLGNDTTVDEMVHMVSIPDGMEPGEDRNDLARLTESLMKSIYAGELVALIHRINNAEEGESVTCLVVDCTIGFTLGLVENLGIKRVGYCIAAAACLGMSLNIPNLIVEGFVDQDGKVLKDEMISQLPGVVNSANLIWSNFDGAMSKLSFNLMKEMGNWIKSADLVICNSSLDLEPDAFSKIPQLRPVGPLLSINRSKRSKCNFWRENNDCLTWLHQQPPNSVIYIAVGSLAIFDPVQFKEFASGLELTNHPFLWVVRKDSTINVDSSYPQGFKERTRKHGMIVEWAPQQQVLSHPSVACFISHCGWNSTIETIANGVPVLTWPYFADQFLCQDYICNEWKVGLRLKKDENGIIRRGEIKDKVDDLLRNKGYKERIKVLQKKTTDSARNGVSNKNFNSLVEWIKDN